MQAEVLMWTVIMVCDSRSKAVKMQLGIPKECYNCQLVNAFSGIFRGLCEVQNDKVNQTNIEEHRMPHTL
jgi:hypothetical protein